jgi:hypothetical protein
MQTQMALNTPVDTLNYVLTLEHLVHAFYRDGLQRFDANAFAAAGYAANVFQWFAMIRDDEQDHVDSVTEMLGDRGGKPTPEGTYNFSYGDLAGFIGAAQELENTVVSAYQGVAGHLIADRELLTGLLTIHGVEARHAAYVSGLLGDSPFPDAFNPTMTPEETIAITRRFTTAD